MKEEKIEISTENLAARLWRELTRAPHDKHHEWRTPVLATEGVDQMGPQARTVVLRHADAALCRLRVYSHARSPKCLELVAQPLAQLTFWSKRLNWQLRVSAQASIEFEGDQVNVAWNHLRQSRAAADYLSETPPGQIQLTNQDLTKNAEDSLRVHHLAILNFQVISMDWLALSKDGHRRAGLTPSGVVNWLVP